MRYQTGDALGVGSDPARDWHGLRTIILIPTRFLPRAASGSPRAPAPAVSFLPLQGCASGRVVGFPESITPSRLLPLPRSLPPLLFLDEPPLGRASFKSFGCPFRVAPPFATWGGGQGYFTPL